jgi:8-oxo-dGTP pyrophosphatase MutT (NUDIX family)
VTRLFDAACRIGLICAYRLALLYWMLRRPTLHGVYVALWHDERVLLIQNSYKRLGSFPGGGVGRGESARSAARRELFEEVGVAIAETELREVAEYTHFIAWHTEHARFFEVSTSVAPALAIDRREVISARFATRDEALAGELTPLVRRYLSEPRR